VIAGLTGCCYAEAGRELIWLGPGTHALHARAVMLGAPITVSAGDEVEIATGGLVAWRPTMPAVAGPVLRMGTAALLAMRRSLGPPRGLGRLLFTGADEGPAPQDPVGERARPAAARLAAACAAHDAKAAIDPAVALLGLGDGLTPDGDDYVGGALFARRACGEASAAWAAACAQVIAQARMRSHPISARLLEDLASGEAWTSLHELVEAMAARDDHRAQTTARELIALGASSGWSVLAGFVAGILGNVSDQPVS
jgi:hypothetical protein